MVWDMCWTAVVALKHPRRGPFRRISGLQNNGFGLQWLCFGQGMSWACFPSQFRCCLSWLLNAACGFYGELSQFCSKSPFIEFHCSSGLNSRSANRLLVHGHSCASTTWNLFRGHVGEVAGCGTCPGPPLLPSNTPVGGHFGGFLASKNVVLACSGFVLAKA